jgi:hypothetical protein
MSKNKKTKEEEKKIEVKYATWVKLVLVVGGALMFAVFAVSFMLLALNQNFENSRELEKCRSNYDKAYKQGKILPPGIYRCDETGCQELVPK